MRSVAHKKAHFTTQRFKKSCLAIENPPIILVSFTPFSIGTFPVPVAMLDDCVQTFVKIILSIHNRGKKTPLRWSVTSLTGFAYCLVPWNSFRPKVQEVRMFGYKSNGFGFGQLSQTRIFSVSNGPFEGRMCFLNSRSTAHTYHLPLRIKQSVNIFYTIIHVQRGCYDWSWPN